MARFLKIKIALLSVGVPLVVALLAKLIFDINVFVPLMAGAFPFYLTATRSIKNKQP